MVLTEAPCSGDTVTGRKMESHTQPIQGPSFTAEFLVGPLWATVVTVATLWTHRENPNFFIKFACYYEGLAPFMPLSNLTLNAYCLC